MPRAFGFKPNLYPFALLVVLALAVPANVEAHPHEFVTMRIEAQFSKSGALSGFRYNWKFDEFFSAYAIEGQDKNKNGVAEQNELDALLKEILSNIHSIGYFTAFDETHKIPSLGKAVPISAGVEKRQLVLSFNVPFVKPVALSGKSVRYAIYDNEFYIAMHHDPDATPVTLKGAPKGCDWDLDAADPDEDVVAYAGSLGKSDSSGGNLGANFAEWVTIQCK